MLGAIHNIHVVSIPSSVGVTAWVQGMWIIPWNWIWSHWRHWYWKFVRLWKRFSVMFYLRFQKSFTQLPSLWDSHVFFRRRPFFCVNLRLSHRLLNKWWRHLFACLFRCSLAFRNQTSMLIHCYSLSQTYVFPIQFHFTVEKSWDFLVIQN